MMKRLLCVRFLNWLVQAHQPAEPKCSPSEGPLADISSRHAEAAQRERPLVLHTEAQPTAHRTDDVHRDVQFLNQVFPSARSCPIVVAASEDASKAGIRCGMTLAEARSIDADSTGPPFGKAAPQGSSRKSAASGYAPEIQFAAWNPNADRMLLVEIAEKLRQFAPVIAIDTMPVPDSLILDVTGCGTLFGGEVPLAEQVLKTVRAADLQARLAISESVASAWAFTHPAGHHLLESQQPRRNNVPRQHRDANWDLPLIVIPSGQAESWLSELPISTGRLPLPDIELLKRLGITSLQQMFCLPQHDLPSRISDAGRIRLNQLQSSSDELLTPLPEANPVQAVWVSEFGVQGKEHVKLVLRVLVEDVVRQLLIRNIGAISATCDLKTEQGSTISIDASVVKPVQSESDLLDVFHLKLETLRLPDTVMTAKMTLTTAPLPVLRQRDLFSTDQHIAPEEEITTLINRLGSRLSLDSVLTAEATSSPIPEQSVQLNPIVTTDSKAVGRKAASIPERLVDPESPVDVPNLSLQNQSVQHTPADNPVSMPIRLLAQPALIGSKDTNPLHNGLTWEGNHLTVDSFVGPQRIQSRWWDEKAVHRDYFRVTTSHGSTLWIFRDLNNGSWYLHGAFD